MNEQRTISAIAREIESDWSTKGKGVNFAARPYLDAMKTMRNIDEMYFHDTGVSVVLYFLANANTWRGDVARRVKKELKNMCGV